MAGDKVSILFGSFDEKSNGEVTNNNKNNVSKSDRPKDVSKEKKQDVFFFVKQHHYEEDPEIKSKLDQLDQEHQNLKLAREGVINQLKAKRAEKSDLFTLVEKLKSEHKGFNNMFDEKRKEMEPLRQALGKLRSNDGGICSSEQELNEMIRSLENQIQHETNTLKEEKLLVKEIGKLEGTRGKVIANEAMRAKIIESFGHREDIQEQVTSMSSDLDRVKMEREAISDMINEQYQKINASKEKIQVLEDELKIVTEKRNESYSNIQETRKQLDEEDDVLKKARDLAAQKKVEELKALSHAEDEKFMSLWCSDKKFREDYEKRLLRSLDARQLNRDGRVRSPEEKPLITPEPSETEVVPEARTKQPKKESGNKSKDTGKSKEAKPNSDDDEEIYGLGKKPQMEELKPVDEATLKEIRRQEEMAKSKEASERKKKLAGRSAEKAAKRAKYEAEKKEKERERKAKKKAHVEPEEVPEASEPGKGKLEEQGTEKPVKKQIGSRIQRRGFESPRPILRLKRKKSSNYLVWAILAALVVLVLAYYYTL